MEPQFWDDKFEGADYFFGTRPHPYFKETLQDLEAGKILVAGDGEGRHAVYAAKQGWDVTVMDYSAEGKQKAMQLAVDYGVEINYEVVDLYEKDLSEAEYDAVGMVYAHFLPHMQEKIHKKLWKAIKPGGHLILIGFGKRQLEYDSGGPPDIDMLYDIDELKGQFPDAEVLEEFNGILEIDEGPKLQGEADQVWLLLQK
jgi:SAM-dependent methyltransferase